MRLTTTISLILLLMIAKIKWAVACMGNVSVLEWTEPFDRNQTAFNHLHILIHVPIASKKAWSSDAQHVTPKSVNWDSENISNMVRDFFDPKSEKQDS